MERCPQCRARLKGRAVCGRCEADLSSLLAIEATADIMARRAVQDLLAGHVAAAARQAVVARDLRATPFHCALAGFIEKIANRE